MKYRPSKKQFNWGTTAFLTIVACMIVYWILFKSNAGAGFSKLISTLMPVIYGVVIAFIMDPVLIFSEKRILAPMYLREGLDVYAAGNEQKRRRMRKFAILMTIVFLLLIIYGLLAVVIPQLVRSIQGIVSNIRVYSANISAWEKSMAEKFPQLLDANGNDILSTVTDKLMEYVNTTLVPNMSGLITKVSNGVVSFVRGIFNFIIGLIVSVYLMNSKEQFIAQGKKSIYALFREETANRIIAENRFIYQTFTAFISGKILDSAIIGLLCYIGTSIIRTPYAVLVSVVVGVTNVIPFFGPYVGAIVGGIIVFLVNPLDALYFVIFVFALQQFDGNILGPKILGDSTGLSSFWVITALLMFGGMFGVVGWLIGVPVFAVLYSLLSSFLAWRLKKKDLPTSTDDYSNVTFIQDGVLMNETASGSSRYRPRKLESAWKRLFSFGRKSKPKADGASAPESPVSSAPGEQTQDSGDRPSSDETSGL